MSFPERLDGGTLVRRDPNRGPGSPYQEPPFVRLMDPLDLYVSTAALTMVKEASSRALGSPDTPWVEVAVREIDGVKYILIAPTTEGNPVREPIAYRGSGGPAMVRTADDVLMAAGITTVAGATYRMDVALLEDTDLKWVLACNWTAAQVEDRTTRNAGNTATSAHPLPEATRAVAETT